MSTSMPLHQPAMVGNYLPLFIYLSAPYVALSAFQPAAFMCSSKLENFQRVT